MTPPRVTLASVGTIAFFMLVAFPRSTLPMADGDAWWHIHAGEEILATGRVSHVNTWTIAGAGFPWTTQDWLSNVLMAALFNAGSWGVAWLSLAFAAFVTVALAGLWMAIGARVPHVGWLSRFLWLTAGLIVAGPIIGIRVQTIDLLMTVAVVWVLWTYVAEPYWSRSLLLAPIALLWVNLHAGWPMLFLLGGAVAVGEGVDRLTHRILPTPPLSWRAVGWLGIALAVAAAALIVNPNGAAIYAYPFETASIAAHRDFLVEWSPPNAGSFEGQVALVCIALVVVPTLVIGRRTLRTADALWLIGLSVMTISAVRFALFLGPVAATLAAVHLGPVISRSRVGRAVAGPLLRSAQKPSTARRAGLNLALIGAVIVVGSGIAVRRAAPLTQAEAIGDAVPMAAADWVERELPEARIFNSYSWGGYLARRLPGASVYIDGRSDIYGDHPIQEYAATLNARTDPSTLLDRDRIDAALLVNSAPLNDWLASADGWERRYRDDMASVWVRDEPP